MSKINILVTTLVKALGNFAAKSFTPKNLKERSTLQNMSGDL
jgi:hypothetical protein